MSSISNILSRPADEFGNDEEIEMAWVMKATQHMEIYFNLITSVDPRLLKLTPYDDVIYKEFRADFPDLDVKILNTETLKSLEAKEKWRPFCEKFVYVEDFNFGTIVRLDCGEEYSDSNSIFVPRIQFYAIEIARNKEGHNDSLRQKFQPQKTQEENIANTNPLGTTCHEIKNILIKKNLDFSIKIENGSLQRGDFSLHIKNASEGTLDAVRNLLETHQFNLPIIKCSEGVIDSTTYCKMQLSLNQSIAFKIALDAANNLREKYGSKRQRPTDVAWVLGRDAHDIRNAILSQHLRSLLEANGYDVTDDETAGSEEAPFCKFCQMNFDSLLSETYNNNVSRMETFEDKTRMSLENTKLFSNINLPAMKTTLVKKNDEYSEEFKLAVKLSHLTRCQKAKEPKLVFHVTSSSNCYKTRGMASICSILGTVDVKHVIFVYGPISYQGQNPELEHLETLKLDSVRKVMTQKYGLQILEDPEWSGRMAILAKSALRFECLSVSPLSRVQLGCDPRAASFIQYNCSRLNALFQRYDQELAKGTVKPCQPENLDFSLLKKQEEWYLLFRYVLQFPIIVEECVDFQGQKLPLHRVCALLQRLSKDFSQYYSRVKLFTPFSLRNPDLLHVRVYLLRGVYQVFKNCLNLLQIEPLLVM